MPTNCWSLHIWTHLGTWPLPRGAKGHKVLLPTWHLKWHLQDGDWSLFYFLVSGTPSKSAGACQPDRVTASLHDAFVKSKKRSPLWMVKLKTGVPLGALSLTRRKETGFLAPISFLSWAPLYSTHAVQPCIWVQKNEVPDIGGIQAEAGWLSAKCVMQWFLALDENLDWVTGV